MDMEIEDTASAVPEDHPVNKPNAKAIVRWLQESREQLQLTQKWTLDDFCLGSSLGMG